VDDPFSWAASSPSLSGNRCRGSRRAGCGLSSTGSARVSPRELETRNGVASHYSSHGWQRCSGEPALPGAWLACETGQPLLVPCEDSARNLMATWRPSLRLRRGRRRPSRLRRSLQDPVVSYCAASGPSEVNSPDLWRAHGQPLQGMCLRKSRPRTGLQASTRPPAQGFISAACFREELLTLAAFRSRAR